MKRRIKPFFFSYDGMVILENPREYKYVLLKPMKEFNDVQIFFEESGDKKSVLKDIKIQIEIH